MEGFQYIHSYMGSIFHGIFLRKKFLTPSQTFNYYYSKEQNYYYLPDV